MHRTRPRSLRRLVGAVAVVVLTGVAVPLPAQAEPPPGCSGPATPSPPTHSPNAAPVPTSDSATVIDLARATLDLVGNDQDPDGDPLTLVSVSSTRWAATCVDDNRLVYEGYGEVPPGGTDTITYSVTDGDYYRTSTATLTLVQAKVATPKVTQRLVVKGGKTTRSAKILIQNPDPTYTVTVTLGDFEGGTPAPRDFVLKPGRSRTIPTNRVFLQYSITVSTDDQRATLQLGDITTKTGRVRH